MMIGYNKQQYNGFSLFHLMKRVEYAIGSITERERLWLMIIRETGMKMKCWGCRYMAWDSACEVSILL